MPLVTKTRSLTQTQSAGNDTPHLHSVLVSEEGEMWWRELQGCMSS